MTKKSKRIFNILKVLAQSSEGVKNSNHTAAILYRGKIIAFGWNHTKTHPFQKQYSRRPEECFFHAEIHAIHNALKKLELRELEKSTLYVLRLKNNGEVSNSCPCTGCRIAIKIILHVLF